MTKTDYIRIDKIIISSPNIQAPAANLPCIKLVSDVNRNLSLANVENVGFIARNSLNGYPESITQMFTDQANTITQNPLNASFDNLDISLQGSRSDMCIDQADTVTQNSMSAFFESINNALTPDSEMFTDQAYTIFSDQAQTCTQKPLDLFYAGNTRQDYDDAVNNNS